MVRKTMRIGEVRTSIKLEPEFWSYLKEVAEGRRIRLSRLVNEVANASPERTNLASTLRTFCLVHARLRWQTLQDEVQTLSLAGNSDDLARVLAACPLPSLLLTDARMLRRLSLEQLTPFLNQLLNPARPARGGHSLREHLRNFARDHGVPVG